MMVTYEPTKEVSTDELKRIQNEIEEAKKKPIIYDEDSPMLTPHMEEQFKKAIAERNARHKQHA